MATSVQTTASGLSEPKLTRYKSVRKAKEQPSSAPPPPEVFAANQETSIQRNLSRYRSARPAAATVAFAQSNQSAPKPTGSEIPAQSLSATCDDNPPKSQRYYASTQRPNAPAVSNGLKSSEATSSTSPGARKPSGSLSMAVRDEAEDVAGTETEKQRRMQGYSPTKQEQIRSAQAERMRTEQAERLKAAADQERMLRAETERQMKQAEAKAHQPTGEQAGRIRLRKRTDTDARQREGSLVKSPSSGTAPAVSPIKDRFGLFKRKRGEEAPQSMVALRSKTASNSGRPSSVNENGPPTIKPGGGGVVPRIDAPVSAVNAGERRVRVECNKSSIVLPVTPATTPVDLVRSASNCLREPINPRASVLVELFAKVGVQRPLRRYEHVRDVMNSWDDDMQNSFVIMPSPADGFDEGLDVRSVPAKPPEQTSFYLYHSQKPGKWDKRWICLRSDGQVIMAKNDSSRDAMNICHMTDFDIYTPTEQQRNKKIKPPKKYCYGIKSQQKSSMFESTASFIHFFCTNDKGIADSWYRAIQRWRSWYLVNVMGEGLQKNVTGTSEQAKTADPLRPDSKRRPRTGQSIFSSQDLHYQLGSFRPVLDINQFPSRRISEPQIQSPMQASAAINTRPLEDTKAIHARNMSMRTRAPPPVSLSRSLSKEPDTVVDVARNRGPSLSQGTHAPSAVAAREDQTFVASGLLGRQYSQRQQVQRDREDTAKDYGPFTAGPSLLNGESMPAPARSRASRHEGSKVYRTASVREQKQSLDVTRSSSVTRRENAKPLVDLTPEYREPPQHSKKGKGFVPEQVGAGGLIDSATSPEMPYYIPPATDWRGRNALATARPTTSVGASLPSPTLPLITGSARPDVVDTSLSRTRSVRARDGLTMGPKLDAAADSPFTAPPNYNEAFTNGQTLLAYSGPSQGASAAGKGVISGYTVDAALRRGNTTGQRPLVDLSAGSKFAKGSLLDQAASGDVREGMQGVAPIDRTRRRSFEVATGEGFHGRN